jgi:hypothetical protein
MIVAISGSGGFIGRELAEYFRTKGIQCRKIDRINHLTPVEDVIKCIDHADVVINLAGAPITRRWTREYKKIIYDSRIVATQKISEAIAKCQKPPELLVSASAVGIYSQAGVHTETQFLPADDFLGHVCAEWEKEALSCKSTTRVAIIRLGIVLGRNGGMLTRVKPLFRYYLGGPVGSGKQAFPWIHIYDVVQSVQFLMDNREIDGVFNLTSPDTLEYGKFARVLGRLMHKPSWLPVPVFMLKLIFGEGATAFAGGQHAVPERLISSGYHFCYPVLSEALKDILEN